MLALFLKIKESLWLAGSLFHCPNNCNSHCSYQLTTSVYYKQEQKLKNQLNHVSACVHTWVSMLMHISKISCVYVYKSVCAVLSCSVVSDSVIPWIIAHQAPLSIGFSRREYWSGLPCLPLGDLPNTGIKPRSPSLRTDSLPSEPPGKPKNTGIGSLFLLQGIFPTQESNQGLLHCRWIPNQMSCQGSP